VVYIYSFWIGKGEDMVVSGAEVEEELVGRVLEGSHDLGWRDLHVDGLEVLACGFNMCRQVLIRCICHVLVW
jgi:hypothetical protein